MLPTGTRVPLHRTPDTDTNRQDVRERWRIRRGARWAADCGANGKMSSFLFELERDEGGRQQAASWLTERYRIGAGVAQLTSGKEGVKKAK